MSEANDESERHIGSWSPGRLLRLARKELRETLRDRRTILTLVLMPLFVYPLLGLTFQKFLLSQAPAQVQIGPPEYVLGFASEADAERFRPAMETIHRLQRRRNENAPRAEPQASFTAFVPHRGSAGVADLVRHGVVDVGIIVRTATSGDLSVVLVVDPKSATSTAARRELEEGLRSINDAWYRRLLRRAGIDEPPPVMVSAETIESEGGTATTIATVLPFILLLMTVTGAVYPAIDLTAGERERGTLEPLIAAPVSRQSILAAKYVAVFTVAVITAGMNLIAMTVTTYSLGLDRYLFGGGMEASAISQVVALVLAMAAFFSAALLLVTSFARSFKEAQAYLIPLMLVSLAPGIASLMPDLKLTLPLAITPLLGIVLLARDLLTGQVGGLMLAACAGSTFVYAALALWLASRAFGTDAVLYGSEGTWSELFRRPESPRRYPTLPVALGCLAAIVPAFLVLGPLLGRMAGMSAAVRIGLSALLTILLFFVLPTLAALWGRASPASTFRLNRPATVAWAGAVLLGLSLWPFAYEITLLTISTGRIEAMRELFEPIRAQFAAVPLWVTLIAFAFVPAMCEEWCFRGLLLSALRTRMRAWQAVLIAGLAFGVLHVVVRDSLFFERLVPTTLLGVVLGAVCVRTGSLWPGMVLHALHNGLLLSLTAWEQQLIALGWSGGDRTHLPWYWLAIAGALAFAGAFLIRRSCRKTQPA